MSLNAIITLNLAIIITHQIDAAYWHEWDMFMMPGGVQLFNVLNLLIFLVLLPCYAAAMARRKAGFAGSLIIAGGSSLIFLFHSGFALAGFTQFHLPVSVMLIGASILVSLVQVVLTLRQRDSFKTS